MSDLEKLNSRLICLVQSQENRRYYIESVINLLVPQAKVIEVNGETSGAACTSLLAVNYIDTNEPLVIVNGDQIINEDLGKILTEFQDKDLDGGMIVFEAVHPRWSYVRCNSEGFVIETAEKRPISNLATAGFYYFRKGCDYVSAAKIMIQKNAQVEGNFYVCPVYNELLLKQAKIGIYKMSRKNYISLATPQNIRNYEECLNQRGSHFA